ncbi:MAG: tetratricopeptide repeat protein [Candidatus Muiribacteriota bacterium]
MIRTCRGDSAQVMQGDDVVSHVQFSDDKKIKIIDFGQFKVEEENIKPPANKRDYDTLEAIPGILDNIMSLLEEQRFQEAEDLILKIEPTANAEQLIWLLFFKAQVYYLQGDYQFAKVFFDEFLKMHPEHELNRNARMALRYMNAQNFI